jgi:hypothetical protein
VAEVEDPARDTDLAVVVDVPEDRGHGRPGGTGEPVLALDPVPLLALDHDISSPDQQAVRRLQQVTIGRMRRRELIDRHLAVAEQPEGVVLPQILQPAEPALVGGDPVPVAVAQVVELAPLQAHVEQPHREPEQPVLREVDDVTVRQLPAFFDLLEREVGLVDEAHGRSRRGDAPTLVALDGTASIRLNP